MSALSSPYSSLSVRRIVTETASGDFACFAIPALAFLHVEVGGVLFATDICLLAALPFVLERRRWLEIKPARAFLYLGLLWLAGQILTDVLRQSPFVGLFARLEQDRPQPHAFFCHRLARSTIAKTTHTLWRRTGCRGNPNFFHLARYLCGRLPLEVRSGSAGNDPVLSSRRNSGTAQPDHGGDDPGVYRRN